MNGNFRLELEALQAISRQDLTRAERSEMNSLSSSILVLKEKINDIVEELGGNEYRDTPGARSEPSYFATLTSG